MKKADKFANSEGSTANIVKKQRERMEAAKSVGRDAHNRSGKYDGLTQDTSYGSTSAQKHTITAPREGRKRKHYGKSFNEY